MLFKFTALTALFALAASATASPLTGASEVAVVEKRENGIKYLGSKGNTLSGGTKFGDLVFVSGQVPLLNGTVVPGGVRNQTAFVIDRIGDILKEGGTDWSKVLKCTVLVQTVNEVYSAMIPNPKPARAAFEVGNLPVFGISVEIEAIAAVY